MVRMVARGRNFPGLQVLVAVLAAALAGACEEPPPSAIGGTARVIDGDTVEIAGRRVRFNDVRSPEIADPLGPAAADHLRGLIAGRPLRCRILGFDRYKRLRGRCLAGATALSEAMVRDGWAAPYAAAPKAYAPLLAGAKAARRGMWRALPE